MRPLATADVAAMHRLRNRFGPEVAAEKSARLEACSSCAFARPRAVRQYHETLLFMAAHPESRGQAALVDAELRRIEAAAPALYRSDSGARILEGCGLAGETVEADFSIALIEWMLARFPDQVELAWDEGSLGSGLEAALTLAALTPERDGRLHAQLDMERWLRLATGDDPAGPRAVRWVLEALRTLVPDPEVRDVFAESAGLRVRWRLATPGPTRTLARFPARRAFMQRTPPKRTFDVPRLLRRPLPAPVRLSPVGARELIDVARGVLAVREREADPVTYANPREVTLFTLDRGVDIALFGLEPARRLPIESYFGYIAARNRVPVAYGGAWIMDRRAEVGVHLFETFRGGESAYLFGQVLRTYRHQYGVTRFQVDPFQFGADNPDAIRSGAFWFYHRFGFRPLDAALRELAATEWTAIRADRAYRTSPAVLRRFTNAPLVLDLDGGDGGDGATHHADPTRLGVAVTGWIREHAGADRLAAQRSSVRRVRRLLPTGERDRGADDERRAFERLCPLVAALPGVKTWPVADRRALAAVLRAKGGPRERDYVLRLQRHERLRAALAALEASVDWTGLVDRPPRHVGT